jgi:hypothetical protein
VSCIELSVYVCHSDVVHLTLAVTHFVRQVVSRPDALHSCCSYAVLTGAVRQKFITAYVFHIAVLVLFSNIILQWLQCPLLLFVSFIYLFMCVFKRIKTDLTFTKRLMQISHTRVLS